eukprot:SAG22_NODE_188_length_15821_cov_38.313319_10_plen_170_part_00
MCASSSTARIGPPACRRRRDRGAEPRLAAGGGGVRVADAGPERLAEALADQHKTEGKHARAATAVEHGGPHADRAAAVPGPAEVRAQVQAVPVPDVARRELLDQRRVAVDERADAGRQRVERQRLQQREDSLAVDRGGVVGRAEPPAQPPASTSSVSAPCPAAAILARL